MLVSFNLTTSIQLVILRTTYMHYNKFNVCANILMKCIMTCLLIATQLQLNLGCQVEYACTYYDYEEYMKNY